MYYVAFVNVRKDSILTLSVMILNDKWRTYTENYKRFYLKNFPVKTCWSAIRFDEEMHKSSLKRDFPNSSYKSYYLVFRFYVADNNFLLMIPDMILYNIWKIMSFIIIKFNYFVCTKFWFLMKKIDENLMYKIIYLLTSHRFKIAVSQLLQEMYSIFCLM